MWRLLFDYAKSNAAERLGQELGEGERDIGSVGNAELHAGTSARADLPFGGLFLFFDTRFPDFGYL